MSLRFIWRATVAIPLLCLAGCTAYVDRPPAVTLPSSLTTLAPNAAGKTVSVRAYDNRAPDAYEPCDLTPRVREELSRTLAGMGLVPVDKGPADYAATAHVYQCYGLASEAWPIFNALLSGFSLGIIPAGWREYSGLELSIHREGQLLYRHRSQTRITEVIGLLMIPVALSGRRDEAPAQALARHLVHQQLLELDQQGGL